MTPAQRGVARGAGCALAVGAAILVFGLDGAPGVPIRFVDPSLTQRLILAVAAWLAPVASLGASIFWVANIRGRSAADIDGAGLTVESPAIRVSRAVLANTHEQASLAIPVYTGLAITLSPGTLLLPVLLSAAFAVGRIAFAVGYRHGAAARSFGMALTGYPTLAGFAVLIWRMTAILR